MNTEQNSAMEVKAKRGRPVGTASKINTARINSALSRNIPAVLGVQDVSAITGYSRSQLTQQVSNGFPAPLETHGGWRKWSSEAIKKWLEDNGLPTVFGEQ